MGWMDETLEFADATSVGTPNNTTVNVGDIIDTEALGRDLGNGQPLYLVVGVDTLVESGGAATVRFKLASDATTTIAVDGTQSEHITSDSIAVATLVAGYQFIATLPQGSQAYERYLAFQVEEDAGQALTAGNVNAFITAFPPTNWKSYADNQK